MQMSGASTPQQQSLVLPDMASTATSRQMQDSAVISYGDRLAALEIEQKKRGSTVSQAQTAAQTPVDGGPAGLVNGKAGGRKQSKGSKRPTRSTTDGTVVETSKSIEEKACFQADAALSGHVDNRLLHFESSFCPTGC